MTEDHDAELDAIVAMVASAGLLIETTEDGKPALQFTPKGAQVARQMAMGSEDEASRCSTRCWTTDPKREEARPSRDGPRSRTRQGAT